jgi:type IV pilus assembly protein PilW
MSPPLPMNGAIIGTDAITVQYGESCGGYVTGPIATVNPTGNIAAGNTCGINLGTGITFATLGTPLIISDCQTAHLFRASAVATQNKDNTGAGTGTLLDKPAPGYAAGSEIMLFRSYTYFIRPGASGQPALWRLNNNYPVVANSNPEEMIEGVEDMEVLYGIETDTGADVATLVDDSANRYVEADNIPNLDPNPLIDDWRRVVSVRIVLTLRSIEDNVRSANTRPYNGGNVTDRRIVRTFTSTIGLRNR